MPLVITPMVLTPVHVRLTLASSEMEKVVVCRNTQNRDSFIYLTLPVKLTERQLLWPLANPSHPTRDSHNTGNFMPYFSEQCVGFLTSHIELINMDGIRETGPTVYSPNPRRLECLSISEYNYKSSTFSSVILRR